MFVLVVMAGCASIEVTEREAYKGAKLLRPDRIIFYHCIANPADVPPEWAFADHTADADSQLSQEQLKATETLGAEVAKQLVEKLREAGLPAVEAAGQSAPQVNDIVIRGYLFSVDKGSAAKRVLVGFGAGDAELMTAVEGCRMTLNGLRLLGCGELKSGGGEVPGLILPAAVMAATANPIGLIVGGAVTIAGEADGSATIEGPAKRTADEIAAQPKAVQPKKAAHEQGWI